MRAATCCSRPATSRRRARRSRRRWRALRRTSRAHANLALTLQRLAALDASGAAARARARARAGRREHLVAAARQPAAAAARRRRRWPTFAASRRTRRGGRGRSSRRWRRRALDGDAAHENAALHARCAWPYRAGRGRVARRGAVARAVLRRPREQRLLALYRDYDALVRTELAARATPRRSRRRCRRRDGRPALRIGYLSADFRAHVMGALCCRCSRAHDRARFDVRLYSLAPPASDDATDRRASARCRRRSPSLAAQDDAPPRGPIAADDLDLLVDLMGHIDVRAAGDPRAQAGAGRSSRISAITARSACARSTSR